jgi:parallel beta-helix repeat protein
VLIDGVTVRGASDAGIHVAQSRQVIVRNSRSEYNVAGIEIVNSSNVDVFGNVVTNNTGGILVFNLPDLPVKEGRDIRVFDNQVFSNNTPNFAPPGDLVASVPAGTGIMVMAARGVHVFRNQLSMNQSVHLLIAAYFLPLKDPYFDPFPADIVVRANRYGVGGDSPQGMLKTAAAALDGGLPPIVWDGITTHRLTTKPPALAILEPRDVGFLDLRLARTPVDLNKADPVRQRPPAVRVAEPETVVVPQDPL